MTSPDQHNDSIAAHLARHDSDIEAMVRSISNLSGLVTDFKRDMDKQFETLRDRNRPNFGLFAQWIALGLSVVGLVGGAVAYSLNDKISGVSVQAMKSDEYLTQAGIDREAKIAKEMDRAESRREVDALALRETVKETALTLQAQMDRRLGTLEMTNRTTNDRDMDQLYHFRKIQSQPHNRRK